MLKKGDADNAYRHVMRSFAVVGPRWAFQAEVNAGRKATNGNISSASSKHIRRHDEALSTRIEEGMFTLRAWIAFAAATAASAPLPGPRLTHAI